jgi:hypothetical protein
MVRRRVRCWLGCVAAAKEITDDDFLLGARLDASATTTFGRASGSARRHDQAPQDLQDQAPRSHRREQGTVSTHN